MGEADTDTAGAIRLEGETTATRGAAEWLSLAAAPTFAAMAVLTGTLGGDHPAILCAAGHHASPLGGMAAMYALMSAFHLAPWLKLIAVRRLQTSSWRPRQDSNLRPSA